MRSGGGFAVSLKQQVKLGFANSRSFERQATILQMPLLADGYGCLILQSKIYIMSEIKLEAEYRSKREQVLSKFREEFAKEYYNYDAQFRAIAEMLIRDADPYEIIEQLVVDRKRIADEMLELAKHSTRSIMYPTK